MTKVVWEWVDRVNGQAAEDDETDKLVRSSTR